MGYGQTRAAAVLETLAPLRLRTRSHLTQLVTLRRAVAGSGPSKCARERDASLNSFVGKRVGTWRRKQGVLPRLAHVSPAVTTAAGRPSRSSSVTYEREGLSSLELSLFTGTILKPSSAPLEVGLSVFSAWKLNASQPCPCNADREIYPRGSVVLRGASGADPVRRRRELAVSSRRSWSDTAYKPVRWCAGRWCVRP